MVAPHIHGLFKKNRHIVISFAFILLIYLALFALKALDDNRLVSWQWAFEGVSATYIFLGILAGLFIALVLSKTSFLERHAVFSLFVLSFAISSFFWQEQEVIVDASRYFTQAKHLEIYGIGYFVREWGRDISAWTDMPLIPFIYGLIFRFLGESRIYIQIFTAFLFSSTVVLIYLTGRRLWDERFGLYAGMLLMGIPYLYSQVPLMLVDTASMFFLMLSIFVFIKALDRGGIMILVSAIVTALAIFTKYSLWPLLPVLPVIFFILRSETENSVFLYRGFSALLLAGILAVFVFIYKFNFFCEQLGFLLAYQIPGLKNWGESFISSFFFQISPLITLAALCSVYAAVRKKDKKYLLIILPLLFIIIFQVQRIRYTVVIFPMLCMAASYGLSCFKNSETSKFISLSAAVLSVMLAVFVYLPFMGKLSAVNLKAAGRFLDTLEVSDVEVITTPLKDPVLNPAVAAPLLDLFTGKNIHYDYIPGFGLGKKETEESSLRFTWEYKNPGYYAIKPREEKTALVIIAGERAAPVPEGLQQKIKRFHQSKVFDRSDDIFRHKTFVTIYFD